MWVHVVIVMACLKGGLSCFGSFWYLLVSFGSGDNQRFTDDAA